MDTEQFTEWQKEVKSCPSGLWEEMALLHGSESTVPIGCLRCHVQGTLSIKFVPVTWHKVPKAVRVNLRATEASGEKALSLEPPARIVLPRGDGIESDSNLIPFHYFLDSW